VAKFHFTNSKLRKIHFSTKKLIGKLKMSKSRGIVPPDSLPTHMSIDVIFFKSSYLDSYKSITETVGNRNTGKER